MARSRVNEHPLDVNDRTETQIEASYRMLLQSDPTLAEETHRFLVDAQRRHGLYMRERMLCHVSRPRFITRLAQDELTETAEHLAAMFEQVGSRLLESDDLMRRIDASEQELEFWSIDPGYPGFTLTSRLDAFVANGVPRFVEYNAESPASIGFCDCLTDIFLQLPVMQRLDGRDSVERFETRRHLLDTLLWAYSEWGGTGTPTIAIVDWDDVVTRRDFELCGDFFREHGVRTRIADPRRLRYEHGTVWLDDERITLVYRRVLLHELLEHADEAAPLLGAYRDGAVCLVNSPRSKMLHKKATMALLSDPDSGMTLSDDDRRLVERTIPWTRRVAHGATTYAGTRVDFASFVLANRERLVLKPSDDYGGKGVVLGWEVSEEEWARAIEASEDKPSVVQERVEVPREQFPAWRDGAVDFMSLLVDTDPLLFRGRVGGTLTRVSGSALLNVSAGTGSTTPTFVVRTEE